MAMHVQRVGVVGAVAQDEAVALALVQHELVLVRIWLAVDREGLNLPEPPGIFSKTMSMFWRGRRLQRMRSVLLPKMV